MASQRTQQVGGSGGAPFTDDLTNVVRLAQIIIRHGAWVDAIQCSWEMLGGSLSVGVQHGGNGGVADVITLAPDENITRISGRSGVYIDQLVITTTKRTCGPYGGNGGIPFDLSPAPGATIGFFGRSGLYLDALGALLPDQVDVPDVLDKKKLVAENLIVGAGLVPKYNPGGASDSKATVVDQDPAGGTTVSRGTRVLLTLTDFP
ncbi:MAG: jacalin-like lectin [Anaerolineae bacterium]